jgi:hypothetical protein
LIAGAGVTCFEQQPLTGCFFCGPRRARPAEAGLAYTTAAAFIGRRAGVTCFEQQPLSGCFFCAPRRVRPAEAGLHVMRMCYFYRAPGEGYIIQMAALNGLLFPRPL